MVARVLFALCGIGLAVSRPLFVELGGEVIVPDPTMRWCKAGNPGSPRQPDGRSFTHLTGPPAMATGYSVYSRIRPLNATHSLCPLPPVDAAASVGLFVTADDASNCTASSAVCAANWELLERVQFEPLLQAALDRRPYTQSGPDPSLLVGVSQAAAKARGAPVSLSVAIRSVMVLQRSVVTGSFLKLPFELPPGTPSGLHDVDVCINATVDSESVLVCTRLLLHTAADTAHSLIQVDYARRTLRVNDSMLLIQGYYNVPSCGNHSAAVCFNLPDIARQAELGYTAVMYYNFFNSSLETQQLVLDSLAAHGMYLMAAIQLEMEFGVVQHGLDSEIGAASWRVIEKRINQWKHHPGLLGWYVCDDCFGQYLRRQQQCTPNTTLDVLYSMIKQLDPYHPIIGATNTGFDFSYTHANSMMPRPALDVVMTENYNSLLQRNEHLNYRLWPSTFEPTVNSAGTYTVEHLAALSEQNKSAVIASFAWLSSIAQVPNQLYFRRAYVSNKWPEQMLVSLGKFAQDVTALAQFTTSSVVGSPIPGGACSCDGSTSAACPLCVQTANQNHSTMIASGVLQDFSESEFCALVVLVNLFPDNARTANMPDINFVAQVTPPPSTPFGANTTCSRWLSGQKIRCDSPGGITSSGRLRFSGSVPGGTTQLYVVCGASQDLSLAP